MANQLIIERALDGNGYVAPGAKATITLTGTTTLASVYSDSAGSILAANPIVADANGFWPQRFVSVTPRAVVTDADDATLYTLDPVPTTFATGAAAQALSFEPSIAVPESNVQDAIDYVAASVLSGVTAYGIGVTGNAPLLANINATGTASGLYRFDGATTGTYPTGVAAADTGLVEHWRQTAAIGMMELHHATTNRVFRRRLTAGAWGAWREVINVNTGAVSGRFPVSDGTNFNVSGYTANPIPTTLSGVGQVVLIAPAAATAYTLPAGGSWLVFRSQFGSAGGDYKFVHAFDVQAGGTTFTAPAAGIAWVGWAWRYA